MNIFEQYLYDSFVSEIKSWPAEITADIYILMIDIGFACDDARAAQFGLRYNTRTHWKNEVAHASSSAEAKWNPAFWLSSQLQLCKQPFMHDKTLDDNNVDWRGVGLRDAYYTFAGDYLRGDAVEVIIDACANVAAHLNQSDEVTALCSHVVPIIIGINNDFNCEEYLLKKVKEANQPELIQDYLNEKW